jgi:hypothetical protein
MADCSRQSSIAESDELAVPLRRRRQPDFDLNVGIGRRRQLRSNQAKRNLLLLISWYAVTRHWAQDFGDEGVHMLLQRIHV